MEFIKINKIIKKTIAPEKRQTQVKNKNFKENNRKTRNDRNKKEKWRLVIKRK